MSVETIKCQYVDQNGNGCTSWFPVDPNDPYQKICISCRQRMAEERANQKLANHIHDLKKEYMNHPRTVTLMSDESLAAMNGKISECSQMTLPDLIAHIKDIEEQIKILERDRRAANIAKRELESRLSDAERQALRQSDEGNDWKERKHQNSRKTKSPEEKAQGKLGFNAWAAKLGMKVEQLMAMDDDEMAQRIALYKKSRS